jgi:hypothetical protein
MEHKGIVDKLHSRQFLCVHHQLERFDPLTYRGGNRRIGGGGRPYSEPNRDQSGGKGKQGGLAHLSSPVQLNRNNAEQLNGTDMPELWLRLLYGHHGMVDFRPEKCSVGEARGRVIPGAASSWAPPPRKQQRAKPSTQEEALRGFNVAP